jgi:hypothetical protein
MPTVATAGGETIRQTGLQTSSCQFGVPVVYNIMQAVPPAKTPHVFFHIGQIPSFKGLQPDKIPHSWLPWSHLYKKAIPPSVNFTPADFLHAFSHIKGHHCSISNIISSPTFCF